MIMLFTSLYLCFKAEFSHKVMILVLFPTLSVYFPERICSLLFFEHICVHTLLNISVFILRQALEVAPSSFCRLSGSQLSIPYGHSSHHRSNLIMFFCLFVSLSFVNVSMQVNVTVRIPSTNINVSGIMTTFPYPQVVIVCSVLGFIPIFFLESFSLEFVIIVSMSE